MKSPKAAFILIAAFLLCLTSCHLLDNQSYRGNFSLAFEGARIAVSSSETLRYDIRLFNASTDALVDSKSETTTAENLRNTALTFSNLDIGKSYYITASFETEKGACYGGKSETFTITSDIPLELSIALEKLLSTPFLLWNNEASTDTFYTSGNLAGRTEIEATKYNCWDDEGTLWYLETDYNAYPAEHHLYKNKDGVKSGPYDFTDIDIRDCTYDFETDTFFLLYYDSQSNPDTDETHLAAYAGETMKAMEAGTATLDTDTMYVWDWEKEIAASCAYNNDYYFISFKNGGADWYLNKVHFTPEATGDDNLITSDDLCGLSLFSGSCSANFPFFWDIQVVDDSIFVLTQQWRYCDDEDLGHQFYNRGGILRFTCDEDCFVYKDVIGMQPETTETIDVPFRADDGSYYFENDSPEGPTDPIETFSFTWTRAIAEKDSRNSVLLGPKKFIAIKPKKLVIADSGAFYYVDENGLPKTGRESRIAYVDLETFAITTEPYEMDFGNRPFCGSALSDLNNWLDYKTSNCVYYKDNGTTKETQSLYLDLDWQFTE